VAAGLELLCCIGTLALSAAITGYVLISRRRVGRELARLLERLEGLEYDVANIKPDVRLVKRALGAALQSVEAERLLELLRRRRRRRYIVFHVIYEGEEPPPPEEVEKAIIRAVERLAGQLTVAAARLQLVYYDPTRGVGILRATHDTKYLVLAGMALVRMVAGRRAVLIPIRTTGTIKAAKKALALPRR
jgi:ribonuclease P/MRP protein subunit POP5